MAKNEASPACMFWWSFAAMTATHVVGALMNEASHE